MCINKRAQKEKLNIFYNFFSSFSSWSLDFYFFYLYKTLKFYIYENNIYIINKVTTLNLLFFSDFSPIFHFSEATKQLGNNSWEKRSLFPLDLLVYRLFLKSKVFYFSFQNYPKYSTLEQEPQLVMNQ